MIKEATNVDFYTTGRQPSQKDFVRVSKWIKKNKQKQHTNNPFKKSCKVKKKEESGIFRGLALIHCRRASADGQSLAF